MSEAEFEKTSVKIGVSTREEELLAEGEVLKFDGFLKVYMESTDEDDDSAGETKGILTPLNRGQRLELQKMDATERFSRSRSEEGRVGKECVSRGRSRGLRYH